MLIFSICFLKNLQAFSTKFLSKNQPNSLQYWTFIPDEVLCRDQGCIPAYKNLQTLGLISPSIPSLSEVRKVIKFYLIWVIHKGLRIIICSSCTFRRIKRGLKISSKWNYSSVRFCRISYDFLKICGRVNQLVIEHLNA